VQYAPADLGADANTVDITITNPIGGTIVVTVNLTGTGTGAPTPTPTPTATPVVTPTPTATPTPGPTPTATPTPGPTPTATPTPGPTPTPAPTPTPGAEVCQVSPLTLNFGSTDIGTAATLSTAVSNTGASGRCTVQGTVFDNGEFSRLSPSVPFNVWAGNTRDVAVKYAPADLGPDANTMDITITNPSGTTFVVTVNLTGTGTGVPPTPTPTPAVTPTPTATPTPGPTPTATPTPGPTPTATPTPGPTPTPTPTPTPGAEVCQVSPLTLNFGSTDIGTTATLSTTISNTGASGRCTVTATVFNNSEFSRTSPNVPFNVWAGNTRDVAVKSGCQHSDHNYPQA
jgi:outer membrane biosynthesis protein TonB